MLGSFYYMTYRSDWVYQSFYQDKQAAELEKISKKNDFDHERVDNMERYVEDLDFQINYLGTSKTDLEQETSK